MYENIYIFINYFKKNVEFINIYNYFHLTLKLLYMIQYHINVNNKIIQQQKLEKKYPRKINKNIIDTVKLIYTYFLLENYYFNR